MVEPDGSEQGVYDDEPPRSIFSALWFRALIVILVLGVIAAVAVPYVLDIVNPPVVRKAASVPPRPAAPAAAPKPTAPEAVPPALPPPAAVTPSPMPTPPATDRPVASTPPTTPPPTAAVTKKKSDEATKPAMETGKSSADTAKMTTAVEPRKPTVAKAVATTSGGGRYWVQVGAFKDQTTAKRLAARLREQNYEVEESVKGASAASSSEPATSADRYNLFVSGSTPADLTTKLSGKGLAADAVAGGVVVKPSLPLRDAVALSRDLAADGLRVQVRRASGPGGAAAPAPTASTGETLHRVRVGGLADRAAAQAVLKDLEGKGYKPFIGRGGS